MNHTLTWDGLPAFIRDNPIWIPEQIRAVLKALEATVRASGISDPEDCAGQLDSAAEAADYLGAMSEAEERESLAMDRAEKSLDERRDDACMAERFARDDA